MTVDGSFELYDRQSHNSIGFASLGDLVRFVRQQFTSAQAAMLAVGYDDQLCYHHLGTADEILAIGSDNGSESPHSTLPTHESHNTAEAIAALERRKG